MSQLENQINQLGKKYGVKLKTSLTKELIEEKAKQNQWAIQYCCEQVATVQLDRYFQLTEPEGSEKDYPPDWVVQIYSISYDKMINRHFIEYADREGIKAALKARLKGKVQPCTVLTKELLKEYSLKKKFYPEQAEEELLTFVEDVCMDFSIRMYHQDIDLTIFTKELTKMLVGLFQKQTFRQSK